MFGYFVLVIVRRPPRSTRPYTRFPYTTLCRFPYRRRVQEKVGYVVLGGAGGLAHPDPHQPVALDNRVAAHASIGGNRVLARNFDAGAARVELHAVVHARSDEHTSELQSLMRI